MTQLTAEQSSALQSITDWLAAPNASPFFVLKGSAGTGKTYCIRELVNRTKGAFIFTAPTNKAVKELRKSVTRDDYKPDCRTIYSLLGLRLEATGEVKELTTQDDPVDLSKFKLVIIDESSMVNSQLMGYIQAAGAAGTTKFLFMGDPAQLPPVKEISSPVWQFPVGAELTLVMRHDNQILDLAIRIRKQVDSFSPAIKLISDNNGEEGVWKLGQHFEPQIIKTAADFAEPGGSKVIAWRNIEVDRYNRLIRYALYQEAASKPWLVGDRVLFMAPARSLDDEPMASTDDEGTVTRVDVEQHALADAFKIFRIAITLDGNEPVVARVLHPDSEFAYMEEVERLATIAKSNPRKWKDFWAFKDKFHQLRHAYAITAHRAQGSTYDTAYVCWQDILSNRNRQEAYRCLYVACTRPQRCLVLS